MPKRKIKTDAQTLYLRREIKKLKKQWADIKDGIAITDDESDTTASSPQVEQGCFSSGAVEDSNQNPERSDKMNSSADDDDDSEVDDADPALQDYDEDECQEWQPPSPPNFPDEFFERTPSPELASGINIDHSAIETKPEICVTEDAVSVNDEATNRSDSEKPVPLDLNNLTMEEDVILSAGNLAFFSVISPELEDSVEALRDALSDAYPSPLLHFNPVVCSSPIPDRKKTSFESNFNVTYVSSVNLVSGTRSMNAFEGETSTSGQMESGEIAICQVSTASKMADAKPRDTSAIEFSVYPTPDEVAENSWCPVSKVGCVTRSSLRKAQRPAEKKARRMVKKTKPTAAPKPTVAVKTMVKALPKMLEQRHRQNSQQCPLCSKNFQSIRILARHLSTCTVGLNVFVCKTCSASFTDKEKLDQHLQIHAIEAQLVCDACKARFDFATDLEIHERIVHKKGLPRFQCEFCVRHYAYKQNLLAHIRKKHPNV